MTAPAAPPLAELIAELRRLHEEAKTKAQVFVLTFDATERLLSAAERAEGLAGALEGLRLHHPWIDGADCWCVTDRMPEDDGSGDWIHEDACTAARAALAAYRGSAGGGTTP